MSSSPSWPREQIVTVVIQEGVTTIGSSAFWGCSSLTNVTFPEGLTTIGYSAFWGCSSLTNVTFPESLEAIDEDAFNGCSLLTEVVIPANVTDIDDWVFSGCNAMTSFTVAEGNPAYTAVDGVLFNKDKTTLLYYPLANLRATYTVPDSVITIGAYAFWGCRKLNRLTLPDGLTTIGSGAFSDCTALADVTFPEGLTAIGSNAFSNCTALTSVTFPDSLETVGSYAFNGCSSLTNVTFPEGLTTIGSSAFADCAALTEVAIPASVTDIGDSVFSGCSAVTSFTVAEDNSAYMAESGVLLNKDMTTLIQYPAADSRATYAVPEGVTTIGSSAFEDCDALASVTFPDSLETIGSYAFNGCSSLTNVTFPDGLTTIGSRAFYHCTALTEVTLPESLTTIGSGAFEDCDALTDVTFPEGLTTIGSSAFWGCSSLTNVTFPEGLTTIGSSAFWGCSSLTNVTFPEGLTTIGSSAFWGCSSLTNVIFPEGLTTIGSSAFADCAALTEVAIPASVTTIGNSAFSDCTAVTGFTVAEGNPACTAVDGVLFNKSRTTLLYYPIANPRTTYKVPDGVTTIDTRAFYHCTALTDVTLPEGLTTIGSYAFNGCSSLTEVTLPEGLTTIGDYTFSNCTALTKVIIPASVTRIGDPAFSWCLALTSFTVKEGNSAYTAVDGVLFDKDMTTLIQYPVANPRATYKVPNGVTTIEDDAFCNCAALTNVTLPAGLTTIGFAAFQNCAALTKVTIPASVTDIGNSAFSRCSAVTSFTVVEGDPAYTAVDGVLFDKDMATLLYYPVANSRATYKVPDGVITIENEAFYGCEALVDVTLPASVTDIGDSAFSYCSAVTSFTVAEGNPAYIAVDGVLFDKDMTTLLQYPVANSRTTYEIPDGVTTIKDDAFYHCTALTEVVLPDGLKTIGRQAFNGCSSLTEVALPASVTDIGDSAFSWCRAVTGFTVAEGDPAYTAVDGVLFDKDITTLLYYPVANPRVIYTVPDSVTAIGFSAFSDCTLTDVILPDGLTTIGYSAFSDCTALTDVTIPASVTDIDNSAFSRCSSVTSFTVAEGNPAYIAVDGVLFDKDMTTLLQYPVANSRTTYEIPDGLKTIGRQAFNGCSSLTEVDLPASVTTIGERTFSDCNALTGFTVAEDNPAYTAVDGVLFNKDMTTLIQYPAANPRVTYTVPDGVTTIGFSAFSDCTLTDVILPDGLTTIGNSAFSDCTALTDVTIPASVTTIGDYAFSWSHAVTSFTVAEGNPAYIAKDGVLFDKDMTTLINYPASDPRTSYVVPDSVTTISEYAFTSCKYLANVTFPARLTNINPYAIRSCWGLTDFTVAEGNPAYTAVDGVLFNKDMTTLIQCPVAHPRTTYTVPDSVTSIGEYAFWYCRKLTRLTLPVGLTAVGENAFGHCDALSSVKFSGNAPKGSPAFVSDTLTAYYPTGNETWTEQARKQLEGADSNVTWMPIAPGTEIYAVTVAAAQHGKVTSTLTSGLAGTKVTLTVTPDEGCVLDSLTVTQVDGTPVPLEADNTFILPAADVTVTATFKAAAYTVTVADIQHGTVTASPAGGEEGTKITLTVTPDSGYELDALTVKQADGTAVEVTNNTFTMPASNVTVTATFKALPVYSVTVNTAQHGKVTATPTSGTAGTKVTLTVTPEEGYVLDTLTVTQADGTAVEVTNHTFEMPAADVTVTATFQAISDETYTVTVADVQNGKVTADPTSGKAGTKINLTATPDSGYALDRLAVTRTDGDAVAVLDNTFTMPASDVTVSATFAELYTVTVDTALHGAVTASPNKGTAGTKVTLTVTPDSGYELDALTVKQSNGTAVEVTDNTFTMPAANVTVTATFKALSVDKLSLSKSSVSVRAGNSASISATVTGYAGKSVRAVSSNTKVATVSVKDKTIIVTGVAEGSASVFVVMTDAGTVTLEQAKADPSVKELKVTVTKSTTSGGGGGGSSGGSTGGSSGGSSGGSTTPSNSATNQPTSQTFTDVAKGSWYESGVTFVVSKGLFNGVGANQFAPNTNMTRGMLMTVLARLDGQSTDGGATWYAKGMDWAKARGISDGTAPEANITREQLVTMLYRYAKSPKVDASMGMAGFTDVASISTWAADAMRWAVQKGILTGKDGARLDPQGTATRAEVATILQRYVEKG